ncbi:MAG: ribulose-phosphate 3-epimerase [Carboxydocellales bacterium]
MIKLAPSILSADFSSLAASISQVEQAGAEYLHIDVMDGHFVPNITIGPLVVAALREKSKLVFDVHLMIEQPDRYLMDFAKAGADLLCVHVETCPHLHRTIQNIRELGIKCAVALNPATSLTTLEYILNEVDMVLLMSVNPGFGGQKFIRQIIPKLEALRSMREARGLNFDIQVDGGVNSENAKEICQAGANILVAGSAIFNAPDIGGAVRALREVCR